MTKEILVVRANELADNRVADIVANMTPARRAEYDAMPPSYQLIAVERLRADCLAALVAELAIELLACESGDYPVAAELAADSEIVVEKQTRVLALTF